MWLVVRLLVPAVFAGYITTLSQAAAFATVAPDPCSASTCGIGVGTPGTSGGGAGDVQQVSPPTTNGAGRPASGPCPPGQTVLYNTLTSGGQPLVSQLGGVNPLTGAPLQPGSTLEDIYCNGNYLTSVIVPSSGGGRAPAPPQITGAQLAQQAFAGFKVTAPVPVLSPSTAVVNFPTWLWLEGGWGSRSATAAVPGLSATVTAAPVRVVWHMGDGGQVTCSGPGIPYNPTQPSATTNCSYTYNKSGRFTATVTVYYSASWTASDGSTGQLGAVTGTAAFPVTVNEIEAVNS